MSNFMLFGFLVEREQKMESRFKFDKVQAYAVSSIFLVISQQVVAKISVSIRATAIESKFSKR